MARSGKPTTTSPHRRRRSHDCGSWCGRREGTAVPLKRVSGFLPSSPSRSFGRM
jgi:hypothetical protein